MPAFLLEHERGFVASSARHPDCSSLPEGSEDTLIVLRLATHLEVNFLVEFDRPPKSAKPY